MRCHPKKVYLFGPFRLDTSKRLLLRDGKRIRTKDLTPKRFSLLCLLVQNTGSVVRKNDLIKGVWPEAVIEEADPANKFSSIYSLLNNSISKLRDVLGDDPREPRYIETVPKVGYRFIASVEVEAVTEPATPREIAVLPFKLMSPAEAEEEYIGLAIASAVITKLNNIEGILVRPRSAILKYNTPHQDAALAAHELGVDHVLGGLIYLSRRDIRVDAELLDMGDNRMLWSREYQEEIIDNLAVQEAISKQIAHHIAQHFGLGLSSQEEERIKKEDTTSTKAYQAYVIGRNFWNKFTRADFAKAVEYFDRAIAEDPRYAKAYAAKSDCFIWKGIYNLMPPKDAFNEAQRWVEEAKMIDAELASVHTSLAFIAMCNKWDWAAAEEGFQKAIRLNPNHTKSRLGYALLLAGRGRFKEAVNEIDNALKIYAVSLILNVAKGIILYEAGDFDTSVEQFMLALEYDPSFDAAYYGLALSYERLGKYDEALEAAQTAYDKSHRNPLNKCVLGYVYAKAGKETEALCVLKELDEVRDRHYVSPFHLAAIHAAMGSKELVFELLQQARQLRDPWMVLIGVDPRFEKFRDNPQFHDLRL